MWQAVIAEEPTEYKRGWPDMYRVVGTGSTAWEAFCTLKDADIKEVEESDNLAIIVWYTEE